MNIRELISVIPQFPEEEDIIIIGPTASGKTKLSIFISQSTGLPIVNCDTRQFWKNLQKISCSPTEEEKSSAPHMLFNCLSDEEKPSLGYWAKQIKPIGRKIIVGGSMFYPYCLLQGIPEVDISEETKIKAKNIDSISFLKENNINIDMNDSYRVHRMVEFYLQTGHIFDDFPNKFHRKAKVVAISTNDQDLSVNIKKRIENSIEDWLEECDSNKSSNFNSVIGYQECLNYLSGSINQNELLTTIFQRTLRYAKKQLKFMKRFKADYIVGL